MVTGQVDEFQDFFPLQADISIENIGNPFSDLRIKSYIPKSIEDVNVKIYNCFKEIDTKLKSFCRKKNKLNKAPTKLIEATKKRSMDINLEGRGTKV
jgi:hypothetical protein